MLNEESERGHALALQVSHEGPHRYERAEGTITIEPFCETPTIVSFDIAGFGTRRVDLSRCGEFDADPDPSCSP